MNPIDGALRIRLDIDVQHLPDDNVNELKNRSRRCALHRWQNRDNEYKYKLMVCQTCKVPLCLWCYSAFHKLKHVEDLKSHAVNTLEKDAEYAIMNGCIRIKDWIHIIVNFSYLNSILLQHNHSLTHDYYHFFMSFSYLMGSNFSILS